MAMQKLALALGVVALVAAAFAAPGQYIALGCGIAAIGTGLVAYRRRDEAGGRRLAGAAAMTLGGLGFALGGIRVVLVIATINLALAIILEATLSFLGVGVPPTEPSLGTLIRVGNDFLFSGEWWITIFPGIVLVMIALSVNLLGDWLRDALNPRLR